jgi:hypothetical protein
VRETAPATPPATKDARTGWAKVWRMRSRVVRSGARGCRRGISWLVARCQVLIEYIHSLPVLPERSWLRRVAIVAVLWSEVVGGSDQAQTTVTCDKPHAACADTIL